LKEDGSLLALLGYSLNINLWPGTFLSRNGDKFRQQDHIFAVAVSKNAVFPFVQPVRRRS